MSLLIVALCSLCVYSLFFMITTCAITFTATVQHIQNVYKYSDSEYIWGTSGSPLGSTLEESISLSLHPQDITLNGSSSSLDSTASPGLLRVCITFPSLAVGSDGPPMSDVLVWLCGKMHYVVSSGCCRLSATK